MSNTPIQALHNYHQTAKSLNLAKRIELKELLGITEDDEKRLVGKRQTRIYYHIEDKGITHMQKLYEEYLIMINSIERIMENKYENE